MQRILVIEDNAANLELMSYLLNAFGYNILIARDGHEGLESARRESPDAIICDIELPGLSGVEVAKVLKSDHNLCHIPLIAVTAFAMVGDRDRLLAEGFDGYISKPIAPERFVSQVEAFLPVTRPSTPKVAAPAPTSTAEVKLTGRSILVVDNLPVNLELMRSILEPFGYLVLSAQSVDDGLEMGRQTKVDLIISDMHMPDKDGFAFIRTVKADSQLRDIPFMFLSSTLGDPDEIKRCLESGADRFIMRPIEPSILLLEVQSLVEKREQPAAR